MNGFQFIVQLIIVLCAEGSYKMHKLFKPWEDKIFSNDPKTKEKIIKLLGEKNETDNTKNRKILQRD